MPKVEGRICVNCGKVVAADRERRCNHCGEFFSSEGAALALATRAAQPPRQGPDIGGAVVGALVCCVALLVSIATYADASNNAAGGTFVVLWGAVLGGGIKLVRSLAR